MNKGLGKTKSHIKEESKASDGGVMRGSSTNERGLGLTVVDAFTRKLEKCGYLASAFMLLCQVLVVTSDVTVHLSGAEVGGGWMRFRQMTSVCKGTGLQDVPPDSDSNNLKPTAGMRQFAWHFLMGFRQ
jgi:hypothetical protein